MTPTILQPIPGAPGRLRANPTLEYVAGGTQLLWADRMYRSLPPYVDDVTRDFGADLYERMMVDPQVASCVHILKMAILAKGVTAMPAVSDEELPGYAEAKEYAEFCQRSVTRLRGFATRTLYDLLDAMPFGNRFAEIVYQEAARGPDKGKLVLRALKVKERHTAAFVVDPYLNVIGLLALIPGVAPTMMGGTIMSDPDKIANLLPREKFALLTYRQRGEDPRGQSICRPAYNPWWLKMQVWPEYLKYLSQFGGPSIWATAPEGAVDIADRDEVGVLKVDDAGNPVMVTPTQALLMALQEFRNGTAAALPFGTELHPLEMQGEGGAFTTAIDLFDRQMAKAILTQTLATEEGQHQARAAAETHQDSLSKVINHGKQCVEEMITGDLFARLIEYNYGPDALELCPVASLGDTEQQDVVGLGNMVAALEKSGYLAPSQRRAIDVMLGIPPRTPEEVEHAAAAWGRQQEEAGTAPEVGADGSAGFGDAGPQKFITVGGKVIPIGGDEGKGGKTHRGMHPASDEERKEHKVPPGWTDVHVHDKPGSSNYRVIGKDRAGRDQRIRTLDAKNAADAAKFARVRDLHRAMPALEKRFNADAEGDGPDKEHAAALRLIHTTGFRPGSDAETGAKVKAYGATTLSPGHVRVEGGTAHFDFIGKEGVRQEHSVTHPEIAKDIQARQARGGERLFNTNDKKIGAYLKKIDGGFKTKDFRTHVGTGTALEAKRGMPTPTNAKELEASKKAVGNIVGTKLGHAPDKAGNRFTQALESYISPHVFQDWEDAAGKK